MKPAKQKKFAEKILKNHWKNIWVFKNEGLYILDKKTRMPIAFYKGM